MIKRILFVSQYPRCIVTFIYFYRTYLNYNQRNRYSSLVYQGLITARVSRPSASSLHSHRVRFVSMNIHTRP